MFWPTGLSLVFSVSILSAPSFAQVSSQSPPIGVQLNNGVDGRFPLHPDATMTPGALCTTGQTKRYPEGIRYCDRDVERDLKRDLFRRYDVQLGYETQEMPRGDFKIDHYIPLCAGGANSAENLWPQHKTVYQITDPLEPLICQKMSEGVLKQAEAVQLVRKGKQNLDQVGSIISYLNGLQKSRKAN